MGVEICHYIQQEALQGKYLVSHQLPSNTRATIWPETLVQAVERPR